MCGFAVGAALLEMPAVTFTAVVVLLAGVIAMERPGKQPVRVAMKQDVRPDPPTDWRLLVYILLLNVAIQAMIRYQPQASFAVALTAGVFVAAVWTVSFGWWWKRAKP